VTVTDPAKDSTFTAAFPGSTIVVEGDNFVNVKHIYLNGVDVRFNPNYVLKNSIIVSIPTNLPLKAMDSKLPNTIVVENDKGSGTFDFTFLAPEPSITLLRFQSPATAGRVMQVLGHDFYVVKGIVFLVGETVMATVTEFEVSETYDKITFQIPEGGTQDGTLAVVTESGIATTAFVANTFPEFLTLSDSYQIEGDTLTIGGKYLDFVDKVVFPGDVEVAKADFKLNELNTQLDILVPAGVTGSGKVQLVTEFDDIIESPILYNDLTGVFHDFETAGGDWNKGAREKADGSKPPFVGDGTYLHMISTMGPNQNWWEDPLVLSINHPSTMDAPVGVTDATPISQVVIQFNYYSSNDWTRGYLAFRIGGHPGGSPHAKVYPGDNLAGKSVTRRWQTYEVPITSLMAGNAWGDNVATWGEFKTATAGFGDFLFAQMFNDSGESLSVNQFWDNIRFVKK